MSLRQFKALKRNLYSLHAHFRTQQKLPLEKRGVAHLTIMDRNFAKVHDLYKNWFHIELTFSPLWDPEKPEENKDLKFVYLVEELKGNPPDNPIAL